MPAHHVELTVADPAATHSKARLLLAPRCARARAGHDEQRAETRVAPVSDKIEAIRAKLDIVQVVGSYVQLRKQGQRYVGLCPFHSEKSPSFSVSPDKGLFYCFGCHAGGDAIAFVMRHEGLDFNSAMRKLAGLVGVELEPESPARKAQHDAELAIIRANEHALVFFEKALHARGGAPGRKYFAVRGIHSAVAKEWRLGYGGAAGELLAYLGAAGVTPEQAAKAGLLSEDGQRSLFDGRVMFPVFDLRGRLAGFGGRRLGDGSSPKYINTRESALFAKRNLLFGWEHAEEAVRKSRRVILVEGYMDVLACHSAGLLEAVAALGTAFTEEHARHCARLTQEAVVLLDGDAAGQAAAYKAALRLLHQHLTTTVAVLPDGLDPDSCLRERGADALKRVVSEAQPAIEHFLGQAFADAQHSVEKRAQAARDVWPLIDALGPGLERDLYSARLAERVGVAPEQLARHLRPTPAEPRAGQSHDGRANPGERGDDADDDRHRAQGTNESSAAATAPQKPSIDSREAGMLRELLLYPELRPRLSALAEYALSPLMREVLEALATSTATVDEIVTTHLKDDRHAAKLAQVRPAVGDEDAVERAERTFTDVLSRMKSRHVDAALRDVVRELSEVESRGGETSELIRRQVDLSRRKKALLRSRHSA